MYTDFFGLTEHPFELHTDSRFLYLSPAHARTQAFLMYAVLKRDGIVVITGDIGAGKSTMIEDLRHNVDSAYRLLVLHQTQLDDLELLKLFLQSLGVRRTTSGKAQTLGRIRQALIEGHDRGEKAVLIVDDAQNLSAAAIEELRMLADDECDGHRLLGLVLIGQPSLSDTLNSEDLAQVRQRIRLHCRLDALGPDQVRGYVAHRLAVAGSTRDNLFDDDALELIALYSRGLPRLINILCDMSLTGCALKKSTIVTARCVSEALDELGWSRPQLAGGLRSGLGHRALVGVAGAFERLRGAAAKTANWADGKQRAPLALVRLGAHRQAQAWQRRARDVWRRVRAATAAVRVSTSQTLADAQAAAERAANTPAGGGWLSDLRWGIGGLYLARRSIVTTMALGVIGVLFALRFGGSPDGASAMKGSPVAMLEETKAPVAAMRMQSDSESDDAGRSGAVSGVEAMAAALQMTSSPTGSDASIAAATAQVEVLPDTNLPIRDADWLLVQPPQAYTVQIIGARNTRNLARFVRRNDLTDELAYYTLERGGEEFYLLLHGVYDDERAAAAARGSMSPRVLAGKPWIRTFADIQNSIRAERSARRVALNAESTTTTR